MQLEYFDSCCASDEIGRVMFADHDELTLDSSSPIENYTLTTKPPPASIDRNAHSAPNSKLCSPSGADCPQFDTVERYK